MHLRAVCAAEHGEVPLVATWNFAAAGQQEEMLTFSGTGGTLRFSCFGTEPMILQDASGRVEELSFPHLPHVRPFNRI